MAPEIGPADYLAEADRLLTDVVPGAHGTWPRACAWLERLALESAVDAFLAAREPGLESVRNTRAKLLVLRDLVDRDTAGDTAGLWIALTHAGHQHSYDLAPTAAELRRWHDDVAGIVGRLATA